MCYIRCMEQFSFSIVFFILKKSPHLLQLLGEFCNPVLYYSVAVKFEKCFVD